jgi:hypothetical protein
LSSLGFVARSEDETKKMDKIGYNTPKTYTFVEGLEENIVTFTGIGQERA